MNAMKLIYIYPVMTEADKIKQRWYKILINSQYDRLLSFNNNFIIY